MPFGMLKRRLFVWAYGYTLDCHRSAEDCIWWVHITSFVCTVLYIYSCVSLSNEAWGEFWALWYFCFEWKHPNFNGKGYQPWLLATSAVFATSSVHRVATIWCDNIENGNSSTTEVHRAATIWWCNNIGNGNSRTTTVHRVGSNNMMMQQQSISQPSSATSVGALVSNNMTQQHRQWQHVLMMQQQSISQPATAGFHSAWWQEFCALVSWPSPLLSLVSCCVVSCEASHREETDAWFISVGFAFLKSTELLESGTQQSNGKRILASRPCLATYVSVMQIQTEALKSIT